MIAIELDCDEDTEVMIADMIAHVLDVMPYQYAVTLQGR